jgi:hypothetical protein
MIVFEGAVDAMIVIGIAVGLAVLLLLFRELLKGPKLR